MPAQPLKRQKGPAIANQQKPLIIKGYIYENRNLRRLHAKNEINR